MRIRNVAISMIRSQKRLRCVKRARVRENPIKRASTLLWEAVRFQPGRGSRERFTSVGFNQLSEALNAVRSLIDLHTANGDRSRKLRTLRKMYRGG